MLNSQNSNSESDSVSVFIFNAAFSGLPVDWGRVFQLIDWVDGFGRTGWNGSVSLNSLHGESKPCFCNGGGVCQQLEQGFPTKHGVEHDHSTYRTSLVLSSRTKIKDTDYHSPHRTSLEKALVANSTFLYQSTLWKRSKTSKKKLAGMSEHTGQVFGEQKQTQKLCANRTLQFFNVLFAVSLDRMDIARSVKTWSLWIYRKKKSFSEWTIQLMIQPGITN